MTPKPETEFVVVPREPTEAMIEAGRSAVMARDCSSHQWTARQHYEASGNDENIAATPDGLLDERGKIDKAGGAMLVWYAMVGAAPIAPAAEPVAWIDAEGLWLAGRGENRIFVSGKKEREDDIPLFAAPPHPTQSAVGSEALLSNPELNAQLEQGSRDWQSLPAWLTGARPPQPIPAALTEDARDAARYRWLAADGDRAKRIFAEHSGGDIEGEIDAGIADFHRDHIAKREEG